MKVLFLSLAIFHSISCFAYTCSVQHKYLGKSLRLNPGEEKEIEVGIWRLFAGMKEASDQLEVTLRRRVDVMGAGYVKSSQKMYPMNSKSLALSLEHNFGGRNDVFNMICKK
jgi:hypothetical protein